MTATDLELLDHLLTVTQQLERDNPPAQRMQMSCGDLETPRGTVPFIVQVPYPTLAHPSAERERGSFARFGAETPWPQAHRELLESLQGLVDGPVVYLSKTFVRVVRQSDRCMVTVGTHGKPGWTNQNEFMPEVFDYLASLCEIGGCLVRFESRFDRPVASTRPDTEQTISWMDIRRQAVGESALSLVKRPRERLILLLAVYLDMSPTEINGLNLSQVTRKFGRDGRYRVYLKKRLVRKKILADALLHFRKRDQDGIPHPKEPMFRTGKTIRLGRSQRMGTKAVEVVILRYAERALKTLPAETAVEEPAAVVEPPAVFWVTDIELQRR